MQALNDGIVFSLQAVAALSAGLVLQHSSWSLLLLACLPFMAVLVFLLCYAAERKTAPVYLHD